MEWSASQYLQFEEQRNRPIRDLLSRIQKIHPQTVIDLGCGPGNSTSFLKQKFPNSKIIGIDSSEDMIRRATAEYPDITFIKQDVRDIDGKYDLIFSNACLQWIPNHHEVIPELITHLCNGGIFAAQFPMNGKEPLYRIIEEVASDPKWGFKQSQTEYNRTLSPIEYFNLFADCCDGFQIWETKYYHNLPSHKALIDWIKGTKIRPYLAKLDEYQQKAFEEDILKRTIDAYPIMKNGEVILCFNRFFVTATAHDNR